MPDVAGRHRLTRLLSPTSVALVRASTVPNVAGNDMVLELEVPRYPGRVCPVNPKYHEIERPDCLPSLTEVPDLAVLGIGTARLEAQVATDRCMALDALVIPAAAAEGLTSHFPSADPSEPDLHQEHVT